VPGVEQQLGAALRAADVVEHHGVGVEPRYEPGREHERCRSEGGPREVTRVAAGRRHDDEALDPTAHEVGDELVLAVGVLV
jgi:hypothetical protein